MALAHYFPRPLEAGARVAVVAPASPPRDLQALEKGIVRLEKAGLQVERGRTLTAQHGYLAGSDAAARMPKLIIGYSDITALHLALLARAGVPGLSGPMVAIDWPILDTETETRFWELARGAAPDPLQLVGQATLQVLRPGKAEGPLIGGTLSVLVRLLGTPYLPELTGAILFLEDVGEAPYRIDGMLAQLRLAGVLDRLSGVVLGQFTACYPTSESPSLTLNEVLQDYFGQAPYPVVFGFPYGHQPQKNTLPVGTRARLHAYGNAAILTLLEPVVR